MVIIIINFTHIHTKHAYVQYENQFITSMSLNFFQKLLGKMP